MIFAFVFLGEFGYELLNWQGVVRKFARAHPEHTIVACSRAEVAALYVGARYIDVGDEPAFRETVTSGYFALPPGEEDQTSRRARTVDRRLRRKVRRVVHDRLAERGATVRSRFSRTRRVQFVFSSESTTIDGCRFGCDPVAFGTPDRHCDIYDKLDLANNEFARIEPDLDRKATIEDRHGLSLDEPYILVQTRKRAIRSRAPAMIDEQTIVNALAEHYRVLLLEFSTGRRLDSYSQFDAGGQARVVAATDFRDQSCLVHFARSCVFLTEGDFGSHIYVPPLLGRDVVAIAPADVYTVGTTPIEFWNDHVFRFGGQIVPLVAEEVAASGVEALLDAVA